MTAGRILHNSSGSDFRSSVKTFGVTSALSEITRTRAIQPRVAKHDSSLYQGVSGCKPGRFVERLMKIRIVLLALALLIVSCEKETQEAPVADTPQQVERGDS